MYDSDREDIPEALASISIVRLLASELDTNEDLSEEKRKSYELQIVSILDGYTEVFYDETFYMPVLKVYSGRTGMHLSYDIIICNDNTIYITGTQENRAMGSTSENVFNLQLDPETSAAMNLV